MAPRGRGVLPSGSYQVWVCYRGRTTATTSTATLIVWDVTNAAQITSGTGPSGLLGLVANSKYLWPVFHPANYFDVDPFI